MDTWRYYAAFALQFKVWVDTRMVIFFSLCLFASQPPPPPIYLDSEVMFISFAHLLHLGLGLLEQGLLPKKHTFSQRQPIWTTGPATS